MFSAAKAMNKQLWGALIVQCILGGIYIAGIAFWDNKVVFSAFVGCMAGLIPNAYFYIRMSKQSGNDDAGQWLSYAYRSEFGKWLMTGMIFVLAFTSGHPWDPLVLFAGYVLVQISSWFVPFIIKGN